MEFSKQEYYGGLPCSPSGDLADPGIEPGSPALQEDSLLSEPPGKPKIPLEKGHGNPLQYPCLENPTSSGAWRATVHGAGNSWTRLSDSRAHTQCIEM